MSPADLRAVADRVEKAVTTAMNDDLSEPLSEKRRRQTERIAAMHEAVRALRAVALLREPSCEPRVVRKEVLSRALRMWNGRIRRALLRDSGSA